MKNKLIIIGASGHGKVVADIAIKMNKWQSIEFLDDDESIKKSSGFNVIGKIEEANRYRAEAEFFVAIGNNVTRERILDKLTKDDLIIATLIHPHSVISPDVELGMGTVVMAGVVINSSTIIGKGCIINTSSSLDHDNIILDYVHISPGARTGGNVKLGRGTWLGLGSIVKNNTTICCESIIGAGAVVTNDISEPGTYVGVPVRRIK